MEVAQKNLFVIVLFVGHRPLVKRSGTPMKSVRRSVHRPVFMASFYRADEKRFMNVES